MRYASDHLKILFDKRRSIMRSHYDPQIDPQRLEVPVDGKLGKSGGTPPGGLIHQFRL